MSAELQGRPAAAGSKAQVLVVDEDDRLVGALNTHDLFRAKVL